MNHPGLTGWIALWLYAAACDLRVQRGLPDGGCAARDQLWRTAERAGLG